MSVALIGLRFIHLPKHIWNPLIIEFNIEIEMRDINKGTALKIKIKKLLKIWMQFFVKMPKFRYRRWFLNKKKEYSSI